MRKYRERGTIGQLVSIIEKELDDDEIQTYMELTEPFVRETRSKNKMKNKKIEKQDDEDALQKLLVASKEASLEKRNIEGYSIKSVASKKRKSIVVIQEHEFDENGYSKTRLDEAITKSKNSKILK